MENRNNSLVIFAVLFLCGSLVSIAAGASCRQPPTNPDSCCKYPKHEQEQKVIEGCVKTYAAQTAREMALTPAPGTPMRGCCIAECIMNGTGHTDLSAAGLAAVDILEAKEMEMGMEAEWTPVIKATAEMCAGEATRQAADFEKGFQLAPVEPSDLVCHPKYVFLLVCTMMSNLWNCPAKYYTDTKECKDLQEFYKTCQI